MKIALIYNFAQHYRTNIFQLMDRSMDIDFYFGDRYLNVKKMDYALLSHPVTELRNLQFGPIKWQQKVWKTLFKSYDVYIMLGEPKILSSWLMLLGARLMGKRVYFWTHGWYGRESRAKSWIKKLYFGTANGVLLYGNYARKMMTQAGFAPDKLTVIHNSLMYDEQIKLRAQLHKTPLVADHFGNGLPVAVFIGRLTPEKRLHLLIEAQSICRNRGFLFNILIIGDGTERHNIEQLVRQHHAEDQVWLYGPSYDEGELSELLYNSDVCVSPGNIGLTAMHALSYGCPCISHNDFAWQMPEFEAIVEGYTGSFFEREDPESLANTIQHWLTNNDKRREEVRQNCFKEIDENWNPHRQLEIIKSAIG